MVCASRRTTIHHSRWPGLQVKSAREAPQGLVGLGPGPIDGQWRRSLPGRNGRPRDRSIGKDAHSHIRDRERQCDRHFLASNNHLKKQRDFGALTASNRRLHQIGSDRRENQPVFEPITNRLGKGDVGARNDGIINFRVRRNSRIWKALLAIPVFDAAVEDSFCRVSYVDERTAVPVNLKCLVGLVRDRDCDP